MRDDTATTIADIVLLIGAGAAAWLVLRDPRLRRPALRLVRTVLTGTIPAYLAREVRTAWEVSGRRNRQSMIPG
jgi:hypothetical protein